MKSFFCWLGCRIGLDVKLKILINHLHLEGFESGLTSAWISFTLAKIRPVWSDVSPQHAAATTLLHCNWWHEFVSLQNKHFRAVYNWIYLDILFRRKWICFSTLVQKWGDCMSSCEITAAPLTDLLNFLLIYARWRWETSLSQCFQVLNTGIVTRIQQGATVYVQGFFSVQFQFAPFFYLS